MGTQLTILFLRYDFHILTYRPNLLDSDNAKIFLKVPFSNLFYAQNRQL